MTNEIKLITADLLKSWDDCEDGYNKFCEFFPEGAVLKTAINILEKNRHHDLARWLFNQFLAKGLFEKVVAKDDGNIGENNTGYRNTGNWNTGHRNKGNGNKGNGNTGDRNNGFYNKGDYNTGDWNFGSSNAGSYNAGNYNAGSYNAGSWNAGSWNAGNWNASDKNTGHFNTITSDGFSIFNKPCKRVEWENAYKPMFLHFSLIDPDFGPIELKVLGYKEAFKKSWDADPADRIRIKELPNFDAEIFFQISGIDLR